MIDQTQFDPCLTGSSTSKTAWRGFSMVELLVVLGMIAILIAIIVPSLSSGGNMGQLATEASAARQQVKAYLTYCNDHNGRLLPGYWNRYQVDNPSTSVDESTWPLLEARDDQGIQIRGSYLGAPLAGSIAGRYPWRLAPYLDYKIETLFSGQQREYLESVKQSLDPSSGCYLYLLSLYPSLGLNTMWLGGDTNYTADLAPNVEALTGRLYAERLSEIRKPGRLIAFTSAHEIDHDQALSLCPSVPPTPGGLQAGNFRVLSPIWNPLASQNPWEEVYDAGQPDNHGYVAERPGGSVVTAMVDGSVDQEPIDQLKDMRRWANQADRYDWDPFSSLVNP